MLAVGGFITILHDNDVPLGKVGKYTKNKDVWKGCLEYEEILREFPFKNQFTHPTMVIRNDVFKNIISFMMKNIRMQSDYKLWPEILKEEKWRISLNHLLTIGYTIIKYLQNIMIYKKNQLEK